MLACVCVCVRASEVGLESGAHLNPAGSAARSFVPCLLFKSDTIIKGSQIMQHPSCPVIA